MKRKFMIIDDDSILNMIHKRIIEKSGYAIAIDEFTDAFKAFMYLLSMSEKGCFDKWPDIIFLDINMPVFNGWEFLDHVSKMPDESFSKLKIVLLSSSIDIDDIKRSSIYPSVLSYISKPLTHDKLKTIMRRQLSDYLFFE